MLKNLSIFNFKKLPCGFVYFLIAILFLEALLFSKAYLVASRDILCIVYKNLMMQNHHNADVVIFGWSRTLAIDAKSLEQSLDGKITVYNYALPNLGTNLQLYLALKKYFHFCKRPNLIIVSQPAEAFYGYVKDDAKGDGIFKDPKRANSSRFRRFVSIWSLLRDVPFTSKYILLPKYLENILPSINYSFFIKQSLRHPGLMKSIKRGNKMRKDIQSTNGRLLMNKDKVISDKDIKMHLPKNLPTKSTKDFEKFVALCDKKNIHTVFILMPIHPVRHKIMADFGWFDHIDKEMEKIGKMYKRFEYYKIDSRGFDGKHFGDWSHLNKAGAKKFNEEFKAHVRTMWSFHKQGKTSREPERPPEQSEPCQSSYVF